MPPATQDARGRPDYVERLTVPWWGWILVGGVALSVALVFLVLSPWVALGAGLGSALLLLVGLRASTPTVSVGGGELRAGRAHIPVTLLGPPVVLDAERARWVRGQGIDPAAYHCLRGWVPEAVMVEVTDPRDTTPYWYVSSRRPHELAAAIDRARAGA